jgi:hypothetical protein
MVPTTRIIVVIRKSKMRKTTVFRRWEEGRKGDGGWYVMTVFSGLPQRFFSSTREVLSFSSQNN